MLTKLKPCRVCKQMKPESAFAWTLDKNGVRKRTQRCAKCWAEQMEKEARVNMEWHREKRGTKLEWDTPPSPARFGATVGPPRPPLWITGTGRQRTRAKRMPNGH